MWPSGIFPNLQSHLSGLLQTVFFYSSSDILHPFSMASSSEKMQTSEGSARNQNRFMISLDYIV